MSATTERVTYATLAAGQTPEFNRRFDEAVAGVRATFGARHPHRIGGRDVAGSGEVPDQSPIDNSSLTGVVEKRREAWGDLRWLPRDNVDAYIGAGYRSRDNADNEEGRDETAWLGRLGAELRY
jgi:hypothetical protein